MSIASFRQRLYYGLRVLLDIMLNTTLQHTTMCHKNNKTRVFSYSKQPMHNSIGLTVGKVPRWATSLKKLTLMELPQRRCGNLCHTLWREGVDSDESRTCSPWGRQAQPGYYQSSLVLSLCSSLIPAVHESLLPWTNWSCLQNWTHRHWSRGNEWCICIVLRTKAKWLIRQIY